MPSSSTAANHYSTDSMCNGDYRAYSNRSEQFYIDNLNAANILTQQWRWPTISSRSYSIRAQYLTSEKSSIRAQFTDYFNRCQIVATNVETLSSMIDTSITSRHVFTDNYAPISYSDRVVSHQRSFRHNKSTLLLLFQTYNDLLIKLLMNNDQLNEIVCLRVPSFVSHWPMSMPSRRSMADRCRHLVTFQCNDCSKGLDRKSISNIHDKEVHLHLNRSQWSIYRIELKNWPKGSQR
jgi:hypothetical protein